MDEFIQTQYLSPISSWPKEMIQCVHSTKFYHYSNSLRTMYVEDDPPEQWRQFNARSSVVLDTPSYLYEINTTVKDEHTPSDNEDEEDYDFADCIRLQKPLLFSYDKSTWYVAQKAVLRWHCSSCDGTTHGYIKLYMGKTIYEALNKSRLLEEYFLDEDDDDEEDVEDDDLEQ